jgi:hypothetical protein
MTSNIDPLVPAEGAAYTADMRDNFGTAANEISDLQTALAAVQADIAALKLRSQIAVTLITANPPNSNSPAFVTAGIGVDITPTNDSRAILLLDGMLGNTQNGNGSDLQLVWGQGAPPAVGTLVTTTNGQLVGNMVSMLSSRSNDFDPFGVSTLLTGMISGQQYWFDAAFRAQAGTATLTQMSLTVFEVLDPIAAIFTRPA